MKWFKHDSMANRDAKLEKVLLKYGADGYALYWLCLELIADRIDRDHVNFELEHDSETLGARLHIDTLRVEEIMRYFISVELFEHDHDRITCMKLAHRLENSIVKAPELRMIQTAIGEKNTESPGLSGIFPEKSGQIRLDKNRTEKKTSSGEQPRGEVVDNSDREKDEAFYRFALSKAEKTPGINAPEAYARKTLMKRESVYREYLKATAPPPPVLPAPEKCKECGAEPEYLKRWPGDPPNVMRCMRCRTAVEWDETWQTWSEYRQEAVG